MEHLYELAQAHAIEEAELWCSIRRRALDGLDDDFGLPVSALGPLLASLIDELCTEQRRIAFAWRECQLMAVRQPRFSPLLARWNSLLQGLCSDLCRLVGLQSAADLTFLFFEGESLFHLIQWDRMLDRAGLDEMTAGWAGWMQGQIPLDAPFRVRLWKQAQRSLSMEPVELNAPVAKAAARLLIEMGVSGITHRAVAAAAGLTLGVVAHQHRRAADLLEQAYGALYQELTGSRLEPARNVRLKADLQVPTRRQMLGIEELVLAVARGRTDATFANRLRYLRGTTSSSIVEARLGIGGEQAVLISTILSNTMIGLLRNMEETDRDAAARSIEERLFSLLAPTRL